MFCTAERLDHTDTGRIFTDNTDHIIGGALGLGKQRNTLFADKCYENTHERDQYAEDCRQVCVNEHRYNDAAQHQDRSAYAHTLHHI